MYGRYYSAVTSSAIAEAFRLGNARSVRSSLSIGNKLAHKSKSIPSHQCGLAETILRR